MSTEIAVSILPTSDNNRGMIRGVLEYLRIHPGLVVYKRDAIPYMAWDQIGKWRGDGIIALAETPRQMERLAALKMPVVNVGLHQPPRQAVATVQSDNEAIGRLAAEHLLELGLQQFAFVGHARWHHNQQRCKGFQAAVAGFPCHVVDLVFDRGRNQLTGGRTYDLKKLAVQFADIPTPIGVATAHDEFSDAVLQVCRGAEFRVPYDVAIIGVNDYRLICETSDPPLSSIAQLAQRIGFEAAVLLRGLIERGPIPAAPVLVPPGAVIARRSTDFLAVQDDVVIQALQLIRESCNEPMVAADVARQLPLGRRSLDKRFIQALGHPVAEESRLARVRRAKSLLASTGMRIVMVGLHSGYQSSSGFVLAFREETGMTPLEYRRRSRGAYV